MTNNQLRKAIIEALRGTLRRGEDYSIELQVMAGNGEYETNDNGQAITPVYSTISVWTANRDEMLYDVELNSYIVVDEEQPDTLESKEAQKLGKELAKYKSFLDKSFDNVGEIEYTYM